MGWRERDYARFTEDERRRLLGASTAGTPSTGRRVGPAQGAGLAVLVSGVVFALGQLPTSHPIVPALHVDIHAPGNAAHAKVLQPTASKQRPLLLPRTVALRSVLTIRARVAGYDGRLATLEARLNQG